MARPRAQGGRKGQPRGTGRGKGAGAGGGRRVKGRGEPPGAQGGEKGARRRPGSARAGGEGAARTAWKGPSGGVLWRTQACRRIGCRRRNKGAGQRLRGRFRNVCRCGRQTERSGLFPPSRNVMPEGPPPKHRRMRTAFGGGGTAPVPPVEPGNGRERCGRCAQGGRENGRAFSGAESFSAARRRRRRGRGAEAGRGPDGNIPFEPLRHGAGEEASSCDAPYRAGALPEWRSRKKTPECRSAGGIRARVHRSVFFPCPEAFRRRPRFRRPPCERKAQVGAAWSNDGSRTDSKTLASG